MAKCLIKNYFSNIFSFFPLEILALKSIICGEGVGICYRFGMFTQSSFLRIKWKAKITSKHP